MAASDASPNPFEATFPRPLTSLIGRDREIAAIAGLLQQDDVRLVTITGPGGVGKTRLAIEVATISGGNFPGGMAYVPLVSVSDPAFVLTSVAEALGIRETAKASASEQIVDILQGRQSLLVLDNFEHVVKAAMDIAGLLAACPQMTALITSRARLRLSGEWEYQLSPLALPANRDEEILSVAMDSPAIQLFVTRARAASFTFSLTDENVEAVAGICRKMDGIPLAIELAAARLKYTSPAAMLQRFEHGPAMPASDARDVPGRHRTMNEAIGWSYDLLAPFQRSVFRMLGVFTGGFTLNAVAGVWRRAGRERDIDLEPTLESLVDQSLSRPIEAASGESRFTLLEPIRDFAAETLESSNESDAIRDAHAHYFLELVERDWPPFGPGRVAKVQEVEREAGNIYSALGRLVGLNRAEPALRMAYALIFILWQPRGRSHEQQVWLHRVVGLPGVGLDGERAGAYVGLGLAEARSGNFDAAFSAAEEALTYARASENREKIAWALIVKGVLAWRTGNHAEARTLLESAFAIARELDDRFLLGWTHHNLAVNAQLSGDKTVATSHFEEAQAILQELGDPWELADLESNFAGHLAETGEIARSAQLERHALKEHWRLGDAWLMQFSLLAAGEHATEIGMCAQAVRMLSAMARLGRQTGTAVPFGYEDEYGHELDRARKCLGDLEFAAAWTTGETMSMEALVAEADQVFADWGERAASVADRSRARYGLTPREVEVLRLVAAGMSNRQIAEALFISVETVKVHVRSILAKLDLESRTAAAAFAIHHQLI